MINVTAANFETEVITASKTTAVLVEFWATLGDPSTVLSPLMEKIETEYAGRFKLVKIDAEQEPQLSQAFGIRSVPTCVLLKDGQPVDGFMGALPEGDIKKFLDKHLPAAEEVDTADEKDGEGDAMDSLAAGDIDGALAKLRQAVESDGNNDDARFDLIKLLLQIDRDDDAKVAFAPVIAKSIAVRRLDSLNRWMQVRDSQAAVTDPEARVNELEAAIATNKRDFEARFNLAQMLWSNNQFVPAMDELLEILMRDKSWNEELARKSYIAILDIIDPPKPKVAEGQVPPEDPTVATYRRRLSSVVLS